MRNVVHGATAGARKVLDKLVTDLRKGNVLSEDEQLLRYTMLHRGNPAAMVAFATEMYQRNPQPGKNPMVMADEYEREMERKLKARQ